MQLKITQAVELQIVTKTKLQIYQQVFYMIVKKLYNQTKLTRNKKYYIVDISIYRKYHENIILTI